MVETQPEWPKTEFAAFEKSLNGEAAAPLHQIRKRALSRFLDLGFPSTKNEEWKYTNILPIIAKTHKRGTPGGITSENVETLVPSNIPGKKLVFVNGLFQEALSSKEFPKGIKARSIANIRKGGASDADVQLLEARLGNAAPWDNDALAALNTAFIEDGAVIVIEKNTAITEPLHLVFLSGKENGSVSYPRVLVIAETGSSASLVEWYGSIGNAASFTAGVTELFVGENASVQHHKLVLEGIETVHYGATQLQVKRNAQFTTQTYSFGGKLIRNEVNPVLDGENINGILNGLTVLNGTQHVDNHTVIDHAKPNSQSTERYKGIYSGKSRGVFSGTIIVRPDAQKTNAIQSNQSVLLSDEASVDSKPQLKIWADDVKCTHGATVGQLDEEALFYIRSRGVSKQDARNMLIHAFASDIIKDVRIPELRDFLEDVLMQKLQLSESK